VRSRLPTLICVSILVGCAPVVSQEAATKQAPSEALILRTSSGVTVLDVATGEVMLETESAAIAPDWSMLISYSAEGGTTTLTQREVPSGKKLSRVEVHGNLVGNVASPSSGLVALTSPRSEGATPWLPDGRKRTEVVIADPSRPIEARRYELTGNLEPEAFSTDNRELFMIEYIPAMDPNRYRVRRLHLTTGRITPIGRLKLSAPGQMRGTGRMQVWAPSGDELYTLYTKQGPNYAHGEPEDHSRGTSHAFVHVLNLREGWAHCIDLPMPFGMGRATASALAISPDGARLYVSDWSNGAVSVIDPHELKVLGTKQLSLGGADDRTFTGVGGADVLYLAGYSDVVAVNANDLGVMQRWTMPSTVLGLAVSADGERVYVALDDEVVTLDSVMGKEFASIAVPGIRTIENLVPVSD
jgi:hypothetical protein